MYDSTFEGGLVQLLNKPAIVAESAYERHLREAWATYDNELTRMYRGVDE